MTTTVQQHDAWWVINNMMYIGEQSHSDYATTLSTVKWAPMKYGKEATRTIDFPWEYDISGISITCKEAGWQLHYVLRIDGESHAMIFNKAVLDVESFDEIDHRRCFDQEVKEKVEKMELDGDVHLVGEEMSETEDAD